MEALTVGFDSGDALEHNLESVCGAIPVRLKSDGSHRFSWCIGCYVRKRDLVGSECGARVDSNGHGSSGNWQVVPSKFASFGF